MSDSSVSESMTNFDMVKEFNRQFGVLTYDTPQPNIFENKKLVDLRLNLILEEVNELKEAIVTRDFTETVDAIADILYVVYGMANSFGIDADKALDIVHKSNMSKLCVNEAEAIETVNWYKTTQTLYDSPDYRQSEDGKYWVVYNKSSGKILKNIHYTPANFSTIYNIYL